MQDSAAPASLVCPNSRQPSGLLATVPSPPLPGYFLLALQLLGSSKQASLLPVVAEVPILGTLYQHKAPGTLPVACLPPHGWREVPESWLRDLFPFDSGLLSLPGPERGAVNIDDIN